MARCNWVNIGSGNDLLPDGTKPLPEPMLTHQRCTVAFTWEQFHKCLWTCPRGKWVNNTVRLHALHQSIKMVSGYYGYTKHSSQEHIFYHKKYHQTYNLRYTKINSFTFFLPKSSESYHTWYHCSVLHKSGHKKANFMWPVSSMNDTKLVHELSICQ